MSAAVSLIPELELALQHGSPQRRMEMLRGITAFFLDGASGFNTEHVRVFDEVLGRLTQEIESRARIELSTRLAPIDNAPVQVVQRLARDDDIAVAGPVLTFSRRLAEPDLIDIARTKSRAHLLAISGRALIPEPVTDVLLRRGDTEVMHAVAENDGARLSNDGFVALLDRVGQDDLLAEKVGLRPDIPPRLLRELLDKASAAARQRLLAVAQPKRQAEIRGVLARASREVGAELGPRDHTAARATIAALQERGELDETALVGFAGRGRYQEMVVAVAFLSGVAVEVVDRLVKSDRPDPVLILCKSAGWSWATAQAIIMARPGGKGAAAGMGLDAAHANFERLSATTAQRVMRFWQVQSDESAAPPPQVHRIHA